MLTGSTGALAFSSGVEAAAVWSGGSKAESLLLLTNRGVSEWTWRQGQELSLVQVLLEFLITYTVDKPTCLWCSNSVTATFLSPRVEDYSYATTWLSNPLKKKKRSIYGKNLKLKIKYFQEIFLRTAQHFIFLICTIKNICKTSTKQKGASVGC